MSNYKGTIIYDLDETLCTKKQSGETYSDVKPIQPMIDQLNIFYNEGYEIIISTARHMVTCKGDVELVKQRVGQITIDWLEKHGVNYHQLSWGKPYGLFYIDDKSVINDANEIRRRVEAHVGGYEKEYIREQLNLREEFEKLKVEHEELKQFLKSVQEKLLKVKELVDQNN